MSQQLSDFIEVDNVQEFWGRTTKKHSRNGPLPQALQKRNQKLCRNIWEGDRVEVRENSRLAPEKEILGRGAFWWIHILKCLNVTIPHLFSLGTSEGRF